MAKRKKQNWCIGDIFLVPLADGTFSVGQVIARYKDALNSVVCIFTTSRIKKLESEVTINEDEIISALFVTPDFLDSGDWLVVGSWPPVPVEHYFDTDALKADGFVGVKVVGSGIVINFIEACFGLYPWDGFFEADYLDKLLLSPEKNRKT